MSKSYVGQDQSQETSPTALKEQGHTNDEMISFNHQFPSTNHQINFKKQYPKSNWAKIHPLFSVIVI
jgi:hypothetical protein